MPGDTTVLQAQDEFFLRYRWPWFPVVDATSGRFLGLLRQAGSRRGPGRRAGDHVSHVARADGDETFGGHDDTTLAQLLDAEGLRSLGALMVLDGDERLRGVVTLGAPPRALRAAVGPRGVGRVTLGSAPPGAGFHAALMVANGSPGESATGPSRPHQRQRLLGHACSRVPPYSPISCISPHAAHATAQADK